MNEYRKAIEMYEESYRINPNEMGADKLLHLAKLYEKVGDKAKEKETKKRYAEKLRIEEKRRKESEREVERWLESQFPGWRNKRST